MLASFLQLPLVPDERVVTAKVGVIGKRHVTDVTLMQVRDEAAFADISVFVDMKRLVVDKRSADIPLRVIGRGRLRNAGRFV